MVASKLTLDGALERRLRAFIEHIKYRSADAPHDPHPGSGRNRRNPVVAGALRRMSLHNPICRRSCFAYTTKALRRRCSAKVTIAGPRLTRRPSIREPRREAGLFFVARA